MTRPPYRLLNRYCKSVNFFAIILFSQIALKDIDLRATENLRDQGITTISTRQSDFAISRGLYFHATAKFRESKTLAKISEFTVEHRFRLEEPLNFRFQMTTLLSVTVSRQLG